MKSHIARLLPKPLMCLLILGGLSLPAQARMVGEIIWMGSDYCPRGTVLAAGGELSVEQNSSLYALLGNTYGGNSTYFKLPNLIGASAIGVGQGTGLNKYALGDTGGAVMHESAAENTPAHTHTLTKVTAVMKASSQAGDRREPLDSYFAKADSKLYAKASSTPKGGVMAVVSGTSGTSVTDGGEDTMTIRGQSPYLVLTPCMVTDGQFPG